jgi:hypothetical protein
MKNYTAEELMEFVKGLENKQNNAIKIKTEQM